TVRYHTGGSAGAPPPNAPVRGAHDAQSILRAMGLHQPFPRRLPDRPPTPPPPVRRCGPIPFPPPPPAVWWGWPLSRAHPPRRPPNRSFALMRLPIRTVIRAATLAASAFLPASFSLAQTAIVPGDIEVVPQADQVPLYLEPHVGCGKACTCQITNGA